MIVKLYSFWTQLEFYLWLLLFAKSVTTCCTCAMGGKQSIMSLRYVNNEGIKLDALKRIQQRKLELSRKPWSVIFIATLDPTADNSENRIISKIYPFSLTRPFVISTSCYFRSFFHSTFDDFQRFFSYLRSVFSKYFYDFWSILRIFSQISINFFFIKILMIFNEF